MMNRIFLFYQDLDYIIWYDIIENLQDSFSNYVVIENIFYIVNRICIVYLLNHVLT